MKISENIQFSFTLEDFDIRLKYRNNFHNFKHKYSNVNPRIMFTPISQICHLAISEVPISNICWPTWGGAVVRALLNVKHLVFLWGNKRVSVFMAAPNIGLFARPLYSIKKECAFLNIRILWIRKSVLEYFFDLWRQWCFKNSLFSRS